jgi:hypothetical protein
MKRGGVRIGAARRPGPDAQPGGDRRREWIWFLKWTMSPASAIGSLRQDGRSKTISRTAHGA